MREIEITPIKKRTVKKVSVLGSKSFTNRALVMASLAEGKSRIRGCSKCEDTRVLINALQAVGLDIAEKQNEIIVNKRETALQKFDGEINFGIAGSSLRFFTAIACLFPGRMVLQAEGEMLNRPIGDLVDALRKLGAKINYLGRYRLAPIEILNTVKGGRVTVKGDVSSQYLTALLLIAPALEKGLEIVVDGKQVSKPYVDITLEEMKAFGVDVQRCGYEKYKIDSSWKYKATDYIVEGDASGASYFWAIAAVTESRICVKNINPGSLQGDVLFPDLLEKMGCKVKKNKEEGWIEVEGPQKLKGISVNMENMPDSAQTLAAVASFAEGKTEITGLSTLKRKETNRLLAMKNELEKLGIKTEIGEDYITVIGGEPGGARIETYNDHRMAMSFAVIGTRVSGVKINNPDVVKKSYPEFWENLKTIETVIR